MSLKRLFSLVYICIHFNISAEVCTADGGECAGNTNGKTVCDDALSCACPDGSVLSDNVCKGNQRPLCTNT